MLAMATYRYYRTERSIVLAFAAVAISFATMVACGGFAVVREPVFSMALLPAILAGLLAYPFMLAFLVPTRLDRSLPVVAAVTIGSTWLSFVLLQGLGLVVGLLVSIATMFLCRRWFYDVGLAASNSAQQPTSAPSGARG
jgi:hypothetical protein